MTSTSIRKFLNHSWIRYYLLLGALVSNFLISSSAFAQEKRNDAGFAVQFGNGTNFGIQGKVSISNNFSLRPEFFFSSGSGIENKATANPFPLTTPAFTTTAPFTLSAPVTLPAAFTLPGSFTANVAIGTFPAGSTIPAGTTIAAGTVLPAGLTLPSGVTVPALSIPAGTTLPAGTLNSSLSGTSFGLAATYDFPLDQQGRSTAYIGPKISFASASGKISLQGNEVPGSNLNINETRIGLVAGADYGVSSDLTLGANVTYNLSRSVNGSGAVGSFGGDVSNFIQPTGGSVDFGIRASYRF